MSRMIDRSAYRSFPNLSSLVLLAFLGAVITGCVSPSIAGDIDLENNKQTVRSFLSEVFVGGSVENIDAYIGPHYIQHNPHVPDGKQPIIDALSRRGALPSDSIEIKRIIAEDDLVFVHYHAKFFAKPRGAAVVDIFRFEYGKIVEHWDVVQPVPEHAAHDNGMF